MKLQRLRYEGQVTKIQPPLFSIQCTDHEAEVDPSLGILTTVQTSELNEKKSQYVTTLVPEAPTQREKKRQTDRQTDRQR